MEALRRLRMWIPRAVRAPHGRPPPPSPSPSPGRSSCCSSFAPRPRPPVLLLPKPFASLSEQGLQFRDPCRAKIWHRTYNAISAPQPTIMPEGEFHKLADETIQDLLEKLEEYGDSVQMDGFDIDYGNQVLTLRLGDLGTYVVNKQTPNRQIWLSSPVSGPSRFDWDAETNSWVYKRTGAKLVQLLEEEINKLCGSPAELS